MCKNADKGPYHPEFQSCNSSECEDYLTIGDAIHADSPMTDMPDREFIADHMDFPPNFENGPHYLGTDY